MGVRPQGVCDELLRHAKTGGRHGAQFGCRIAAGHVYEALYWVYLGDADIEPEVDTVLSLGAASPLDMCTGMLMDMRVGMCTEMCIDTFTDMWKDVCMDLAY